MNRLPEWIKYVITVSAVAFAIYASIRVGLSL
jgi:hypothetical protein